MPCIRSNRRHIAGVALAMAASCAAAVAQEDTFFRGKTVSMIIGFGPGGGYDTYGRAFIRHFKNHIPGRPDIVLQNMPGAGGLVAANFLSKSAKSDGTAMVMFPPAVLIQPLLGNKNAQFDPRKVHWLGKLDFDGMACVIRAESGVHHLSDLKDREIAFGSSGSGSNTTHHVVAMKSLLGIKARIVQGYKGSNEITLALRRGEVGAMCGVAYSNIHVQLRDDLANGSISLLVQLTSKPLPEFGSVENIYDLLQNEEDHAVATLVFKPNEFGKAVGLPSDTPQPRIDVLRRAFEETIKDAQFTGEMEKANMPLFVSSGKEIATAIDQFYAMPPKVVARAKEIVGED